MKPPLPGRLDQARIAATFDKAAATYERHDFVQREVAARALERLDYMTLPVRRIIDLGSGTGRGARALARRYRRGQTVQCDIAHSMLVQARAREPRLFSRQQFVCADLARLPFAQACFDLAFSNLALQWCEDLLATFAEIHRVLASGGLFLFSTLGPDTLRELRQAWATVSSTPHVNRFLDMHDVGDALVAAGFADPVLETEYLTVEYQDVLTLMRDLKGLGASNSAIDRSRGLLGRKALRSVAAAYETERKGGNLPATYEVIYGHAWASGRPPLQRGEVHAFPLERLRRR